MELNKYYVFESWLMFGDEVDKCMCFETKDRAAREDFLVTTASMIQTEE